MIPKIQKSMLSKDVEAMQPHVRALRRARDDVHDLSRLRRHPAEQGGPSAKIKGKNIADVCTMQISDLA